MRIVLLMLLSLPLAAPAAERVPVARFSMGDLEGWRSRSFEGETDYRFALEAGEGALLARSDGTASGLYRKVRVDLRKTPYLHWSWRVGNLVEGEDEHTRAGDDYPARVYVVFSGGLLFWRTRAINYVWSRGQPVGAAWPNAFTDNAAMVAVESGEARVGQWVSERRNVRADYRWLFGEEPGDVDAVAIMTDTDNTGGRAVAWYGDIWFASE